MNRAPSIERFLVWLSRDSDSIKMDDYGTGIPSPFPMNFECHFSIGKQLSWSAIHHKRWESILRPTSPYGRS